MWYYVQNDAPVGPFSPERMQELLVSGALSADSLVWKEGLPAWQPMSEVAELQAKRVESRAYVPEEAPRFSSASQNLQGAGSSGVATLNPELAPASVTPGLAAALPDRYPSVAASTFHTCCECGRNLSQNHLLRLHGRWVCGSCKAVHVQKLREKVFERDGLSYAGFSSRFHSGTFDYIYEALLGVFISVLGCMLISLILAVVLKATGGDLRNEDSFEAGVVGVLIAVILSTVTKFLYESVSIGWNGYTPGQKRFGLLTVNHDGSKVTFGKACLRTLINILVNFLLGLGYLTIIWDREKRSVTDVLCGTRVVYQRN